MTTNRKRKKCSYCGKFFGIQGIKKHEISCKQKLNIKRGNSNNDIQNIYSIISNLSERLNEIEKFLEIKYEFNKEKGEINKDILKLENLNEQEQKLNPNTFLEIIKSNFLKNSSYCHKYIPIYEVLEFFTKNYRIQEDEFKKLILNLYKNGEIDLQPGGDSSKYTIEAPNGMKFFYLIIK